VKEDTMKEYATIGTVRAAQIVSVTMGYHPPGSDHIVWQLRMEGDGGAVLTTNVDAKFMSRHAPNHDPQRLEGGYLVEYPDGYRSWCPAEAFELRHEEVTVTGEPIGFAAPPVKGYNAQTAWAVQAVNGNKEIEEQTLRVIDALTTVEAVDHHWLMTGKAHIEQGWMAINRAIFRPGRVTLREDQGQQAMDQAQLAGGGVIGTRALNDGGGVDARAYTGEPSPGALVQALNHAAEPPNNVIKGCICGAPPGTACGKVDCQAPERAPPVF
jgi:hypothetical protein